MINEAFALFDRSGSGRIQSSDLGALIRAVGRIPTQAQVGEYAKQVDPSGAGGVDLAQFKALLLSIPPLDPVEAERELLEAFRVFDRDGTGQIPTPELRHIVTSLGEKLTEAEADEMMRDADPEDSGSVDYASFIQKMLSV